MTTGRSKHLIRSVILVAVVVLAFILLSAFIRYNRRAGLFDAHKPKPAKIEHPPRSEGRATVEARRRLDLSHR